MKNQACIELRDLEVQTHIGTYGPNDTVPEKHSLDLSLQISSQHVLIAQDGMAHVFDYDPLVAEIDRLAGDGHYETHDRRSLCRLFRSDVFGNLSAQISSAQRFRLAGREAVRRCTVLG